MPPIDLDEIMEELGSCGKFQVEVFIYLTLPILAKAIYTTQYIFAAGVTEYRCKVPICESDPEEFEPGSWAEFALPGEIERQCYRYVATGEKCEAASFTKDLERCWCWVYEHHNTIVPEFELACQEWKRTLVGTMHSFAYFTALPAIAYFSDVWGRGRVLVFTAITPAFFGVWRAFVNNYYVYLLVEYLESFVGCGTYSTAFILGMEMVSVKNRVVAGNLLGGLYAFGQSFLAIFAYLFPYWRTMCLVIYTPSFAFFSYLCLYKESLRWLITTGQGQEAAKVILRAARLNKKKLTLKTMASLQAPTLEETQKKKEDELKFEASGQKKVSIWKKVLKSKTMLYRILICSYAWVTMQLVYYGLSINSVSLAGNKYINFMISSLIEIPGNVLSAFSLDRFGRKSSICFAEFCCGISLISTGFLTYGLVNTAFTMFAKLWVSMISCSIYIYTVELFPTEARHSLLSVCSMMGRIGSMIAPQTPLLMQSSKNLPNIIFGTLTATAGMFLLLLPETLRIKLPDTVEEAENLKFMPKTLEKTDALSGSKTDKK